MKEFGASGRHAVLRGAGAGGSPARVADSSDPQARHWSCAWIPPPPFWLGHMVALTSGTATLLPPPLLLRRGGKAAGPRRPGLTQKEKPLSSTQIYPTGLGEEPPAAPFPHTATGPHAGRTRGSRVPGLTSSPAGPAAWPGAPGPCAALENTLTSTSDRKDLAFLE